MIRDASPQAVFTYAAHPIVVYTGCSCPPLTNHFTACPLPVRYQSLHVPYHSLTSKTSYHKGQGTLLCVPWVNVWHVKKDKIIMSVSVLCAEKQNTFLYPVVFTGCSYFLLKKPLHGLSITIQKRNHRERFSTHLDSMFGTWVNIRAII